MRENFCDFTFINRFVDQEFVDRHRLFVAGRRMNADQTAWEIYVKSRKAADYRQMLIDALYHPPHVTVEETAGQNGYLRLVHHFEGKPLVRDFIPNTLMGIEYLWGRPVQLETTEAVGTARESTPMRPPWPSQAHPGAAGGEIKWRRVLYTMEKRKLTRHIMAAA